MLQKPTNPLELLGLACETTMKQDPELKETPGKLIKYLISAKHMSVFEHLVYTFFIKGASRSFMSQITRHRVASYTVSSQHYQDYQEYPAVLEAPNAIMENSINYSKATYVQLLEQGVSKEEARQVLPNAISTNILMTANARSLENIIKQRRCKRNVTEMVVVVNKMRDLLVDHCPEIFSRFVTYCESDRCNQGKMKCGAPYEWKGTVRHI